MKPALHSLAQRLGGSGTLAGPAAPKSYAGKAILYLTAIYIERYT